MGGDNYLPAVLSGPGRGHVSGYLLRPLRSLDEVLAERSARDQARRAPSDCDGAKSAALPSSSPRD